MTRLSAISIILLMLCFSRCFAPGLSIAAQKKVAGNGGAGYVIQMGAFKDLKNAEQMISGLRSTGTEVFLARKDDGMYVVQSQSFTSRDKAHAFAVRLVANKVLDKYFIATTSRPMVFKSFGDEGLPKSHPVAIVQTPIQEFELIKNSDNSEKYSAFFAKYDSDLKQCRMPDTFKEIASFFARKAQPDKAIAMYRTLLSCSKGQDFRIGILYSLKPLIPARELLIMFDQEKNADAGSPEYLKKLDSFKINLLFTLLETEPDKLEEFAGAILEVYPGDREALTALAWYHFRNDRYEEAYKYFSELNRLEPEQVDHVTGMIYALSEMKEFEKVMELAPVVNLFFHNKLTGLRK